MPKDELIKNEIIKKELSPHPFSFMNLQALCIFLIAWGIVHGWLVNFSDLRGFFTDSWLIILVWFIVLVLVGIIASLTTVKWIIAGLYAGTAFGGLVIIIFFNWQNSSGVVLPFYTVLVSLLGFILVEGFRRSHKYIITNQRLVLQGGLSGISTIKERSIRFENIVEYNSERTVFGQIFGFGNIIPQTASGLGMGSNEGMVAGGVAVGGKKAKLFGLVGKEKEEQTPRTASYYELHGVYPYKEVKKLLEELKSDSSPTQHHEEQKEFQQEQIDIQKQMRDLLKMQSDKESNEEKTEKF